MHERLSDGSIYVAVDLMFLTARGGKLCLLLSRRRDEPDKGKWALPGSLIGLNESAEQAARRLSAEMLANAEPYAEQLYTFSDPGRDARGRVVSITYLMIVPEERLQSALKASQMTLFEVALEKDALSVTGADGQTVNEFAFDHERIIMTGVRRLRGKIEYTDIGLRFLNDRTRFTMVELQDIFEAVLGQKVDESNFRRFIRSRYEETGRIKAIGQTQKRGRGRPAVLYDWNEGEA